MKMTLCFEHPACSMHCTKPVQSNALGKHLCAETALAEPHITLPSRRQRTSYYQCNDRLFPVLTVPSSAGAAESLHQAGRHLRRLAHVRGAPTLLPRSSSSLSKLEQACAFLPL